MLPLCGIILSRIRLTDQIASYYAKLIISDRTVFTIACSTVHLHISEQIMQHVIHRMNIEGLHVNDTDHFLSDQYKNSIQFT